MTNIAARIATAALFGALFASPAQAGIFTPPSDWWSAGRSCIDSRAPPGLRWDDLPPRACMARDAASLRRSAEFSLARKSEPRQLSAPGANRLEVSVRGLDRLSPRGLLPMQPMRGFMPLCSRRISDLRGEPLAP